MAALFARATLGLENRDGLRVLITDIEAFFTQGCGRCARFDTPDCAARIWQAGLVALRRICLEAGLQEALKWGHPCYMHAGRNVAIIGAFRGDFRLSFMNAALMTDPEGLLERQGPNTRHPDMIRFGTIEQVSALEPAIRAYLSEAMGYAEAGILPEKPKEALAFPEELVAALEADPALGQAFNNLTPGRQKSYVINLNGAKKPETRVARIAKFRDKILAGKGALER